MRKINIKKLLENKKFISIFVPVFAIFLSFLFSFFLILLTGRNPLQAYFYLFRGAGLLPSSGLVRNLAESLIKSSILILTGLSIAVAFNTGLFNIGAEGQLLIGAITAAFFGHIKPFSLLPPYLHIPIIFLMVIIASGSWALIAAILKVKRGVHEVISTIMLNWIAVYLIEEWIVTGPLKIPGGVLVAGTPFISESAKFYRFLPPTRLNIGIFISLTLAFFIYYILYKTPLGYKIRAIGFNFNAAYASGIKTNIVMYRAMFISGALAGLGGAFIIMGTEFQYPGVFRPGYGFDGIAISLIGLNHPFGILFTGLFFGFIRAGATSMQLVGIHKSFASIIEGLAVVLVASQAFIKFLIYKSIAIKRTKEEIEEVLE